MPKFSPASCTLKKLLLSGSTFNLCHTVQSFLIQKPIGFEIHPTMSLECWKLWSPTKSWAIIDLPGSNIENQTSKIPNVSESLGIFRGGESLFIFGIFSIFGVRNILDLLYPPLPNNSHKWRFRSGFPTKNTKNVSRQDDLMTTCQDTWPPFARQPATAWNQRKADETSRLCKFGIFEMQDFKWLKFSYLSSCI